MTDNCDLCVEVRDQDLVVTMPGTSLRVVYRKPHWGSQLVARLDYFQDHSDLARVRRKAADQGCEMRQLAERVFTVRQRLRGWR